MNVVIYVLQPMKNVVYKLLNKIRKRNESVYLKTYYTFLSSLPYFQVSLYSKLFKSSTLNKSSLI